MQRVFSSALTVAVAISRGAHRSGVPALSSAFASSPILPYLTAISSARMLTAISLWHHGADAEPATGAREVRCPKGVEYTEVTPE